MADACPWIRSPREGHSRRAPECVSQWSFRGKSLPSQPGGWPVWCALLGTGTGSVEKQVSGTDAAAAARECMKQAWKPSFGWENGE